MSRENIEVLKAAIDAINADDFESGLSRYAAPDFVYDLSRAEGPVHGVYDLETIRPALREFTEPWESMRVEAEEFIEAGDRVVTPFTNHFRGRDGIEVQVRAVFVWTLRGSLITRVDYYPDRPSALEGAGVSE